MMDSEVLKEIYKLATESTERDTRMETQLSYLEQRMEKQEELLSAMSNILSEYKHLNATVEQMDYNEKDMAEQLRRLSKRVEMLENAPAISTFKLLKYLAGLVAASVIGGIASMFITKLGGTK